MKSLSLCLFLLCLTGCASSVASLAETLNQRNVQSCLWYQGSAGPYAHIQGVTATGGLPVAQCLEGRRP